jgi:endonuclease/exonuclease/phosphatase family metal-dependent hydrolase
LLSRHPIEGKEVLPYGADCAIEDCISNKAAVLVRISAPAIGSVDVLNTHAQAQAEQGAVRKKQFARLAPFVKQNAVVPFVFLGGDFNAKTAPAYAEITRIYPWPRCGRALPKSPARRGTETAITVDSGRVPAKKEAETWA